MLPLVLYCSTAPSLPAGVSDQMSNEMIGFCACEKSKHRLMTHDCSPALLLPVRLVSQALPWPLAEASLFTVAPAGWPCAHDERMPPAIQPSAVPLKSCV